MGGGSKRKQSENKEGCGKFVLGLNFPFHGGQLINENPGALAGATGANDTNGQSDRIAGLAAEYRWRKECAITLTYALSNAHPADALAICCDVVEQHRAGTPLPPLLEIEDEAKWWASMATPFELLAYAQACLDQLADPALQANKRKQLLVKLWASLSADDRQSFLARVDPQGNFMRGTS